jgi:hypothetical protein
MSRAALDAVRDEEPPPDHTWTITAARRWEAAQRHAWMQYSHVPRKIKVTVYYGKPGSGKTHNLWYNPDNTKNHRDLFFPGRGLKHYKGERILAIDDFHCKERFSLTMLDTYIEGGVPRSTRRGAWDEVRITSLTHPLEWWCGKYKDDPTYMARFDNVVHLCRE